MFSTLRFLAILLGTLPRPTAVCINADPGTDSRTLLANQRFAEDGIIHPLTGRRQRIHEAREAHQYQNLKSRHHAEPAHGSIERFTDDELMLRGEVDRMSGMAGAEVVRRVARPRRAI